ncbi:MAG: peptidoglycan editing factor PgeF [Alphaproteobacteria bacterium]|nr:peptidoglycan editing factor PgeF [Alphaproteobacteria bacterium]
MPAIQAQALACKGVSHAFFTRDGGVSTGLYASLNGGVGSNDDPLSVRENRARMAQSLGAEPARFLVPYQIHSPDVLAVDAPWPQEQRPRCDGLVTATRGLALGVTGADCGMVLFADEHTQVIGACHAGWKGALTGVLETTLARMEELGADRARICAVLGPTIAQASYEVGQEFVERFLASSCDYRRFFVPSHRDGHAMFDLPGFIGMRLTGAGVGRFENLALDTYAGDTRFYSYRRSVHRKEADYGRLVAAIALV